ncbi:MAG: PEGA domain-containing protein [Bryobacteraceae bacterium]|nr:PEGA domain-containing protein [Bryobacteraceae bacterium]
MSTTRRLIGTFLLLLNVGSSQSPFEPPRTGRRQTPRNDKTTSPGSIDYTSLYHSPREASVVALKRAISRARPRGSQDSTVGLLLVSAKRDPAWVVPVINLGITCERSQRWSDAVSFFEEAARMPDSGPHKPLIEGELGRARLVLALESSPAGRLRREYDAALLGLLARLSDPKLEIDAPQRLASIDNTRWEAFVIAALRAATAGTYADSLKSLEQAERLAPQARRDAISAGLTQLRREASYDALRARGDEALDKHQYQAAAEVLWQAWELYPSRGASGLESAVAWLMADEVSRAVQVLARLRLEGPVTEADKATAMLRELAAVNPEAASAISPTRTTVPPQPLNSVASFLTILVGDLGTSEMRLVEAPFPALLTDASSPVELFEDKELEGQGGMLLSSESAFTQYRRNLPALSAPPAPSTTQEETGQPPAAAGVNQPPVPDKPISPAEPRTLRAPNRTGGVNLDVRTQPAGASVVFDADSALTCIAPCQLNLAPGRHTARIVLPGYKDALRVIETRETTSLEVRLDQKAGTVYVTGPASGLPVHVDGKPTGQSTPCSLVLAEGQHEIQILMANRSSRRMVSVRADSMIKIEFDQESPE